MPATLTHLWIVVVRRRRIVCVVVTNWSTVWVVSEDIRLTNIADPRVALLISVMEIYTSMVR